MLYPYTFNTELLYCGIFSEIVHYPITCCHLKQFLKLLFDSLSIFPLLIIMCTALNRCDGHPLLPHHLSLLFVCSVRTDAAYRSVENLSTFVFMVCQSSDSHRLSASCMQACDVSLAYNFLH